MPPTIAPTTQNPAFSNTTLLEALELELEPELELEVELALGSVPFGSVPLRTIVLVPLTFATLINDLFSLA